jgi:hypothetical protein
MNSSLRMREVSIELLEGVDELRLKEHNNTFITTHA